MLLTKDTNIRELLNHSPSCKSVLESYEMLCEDCPSSWGETIAEACEVHGTDLEKLLADLRASLEA